MKEKIIRVLFACGAVALGAIQAAPGPLTLRAAICIDVVAICGFLSPSMFGITGGWRDLLTRYALGAIAASAGAVQMLDGEITVKRIAATVGGTAVAFLSPRLLGLVKREPTPPSKGG